MELIIGLISIIVIVVAIIVDIKRIKSNKELIKKYNEVLTSHKKLGDKLDSKREIDKEIHKKIENTRKNFEILKDNLSLNYDHLTEEVIKRINANNKNQEIILKIDSEEIGRVTVGKLNDMKTNKVLGN